MTLSAREPVPDVLPLHPHKLGYLRLIGVTAGNVRWSVLLRTGSKRVLFAGDRGGTFEHILERQALWSGKFRLGLPGEEQRRNLRTRR